MNRSEYLENIHVADFVNWLASGAECLRFKLDIPRSARVPVAIDVEISGLQAVLDNYCWSAKWRIGDQLMESCDWQTTQTSLLTLTALLRNAVFRDGNVSHARDCLNAVFKWGGIRNCKVGAAAFVKRLSDPCDYFARCASSLRLESANINSATLDLESELPPLLMNAMLTKAHALLADDGLPIYDSRVAGSIATLVALYCRARGHPIIPTLLKFPITDRNHRRGIPKALGQFVSFYVNYADSERCSRRWTSAKIRLGWIAKALLESNKQLFPGNCAQLRMRAFEASLFMAGYDTSSFIVSKRC
jgi:hypothetical protein